MTQLVVDWRAPWRSIAFACFDDTIVAGEGAGGAEVAEAARSLLDIAGGHAECGRAWIVGNVSGGEGARRRLCVEGDEGALGVVEAGVGRGRGFFCAVRHMRHPAPSLWAQ